MDPARVTALVDGLVAALDDGSVLYTRWKKRQQERNHYCRLSRKHASATRHCALSVSLDVSAKRIKGAYDAGRATLGREFAAGDGKSCVCLATNLDTLSRHLDVLRQAVLAKDGRLINLNELFHTVERVRTQCIAAMADLYRRQAAARLLPPELPTLRHPVLTASRTPVVRPSSRSHETAVWSTGSDVPVFPSQPPSPPLQSPRPTSSFSSDDAAPCYGARPSLPAGRPTLHPKNSVFNMFCPEAMALQLDASRALPALGHACSCGFVLDVAELQVTVLQEGFRVTRRFLVKSHCDQRRPSAMSELKRKRYGCVLCTSVGRNETFASVTGLRCHINQHHDKWQMLHDRDLTSAGQRPKTDRPVADRSTAFPSRARPQ